MRGPPFAAFADALLAALFAPTCLSCAEVLDRPTASPVCEKCWRRVARFPAGVLCGDGLEHLDGIAALGPFDGVLRDIIHGVKFHGRRSLAAELGRLLRQAAAPVLAGADAAVPVPLHPWRQWRRGYNQAALLAATLELPVWTLLRRPRATPPQTGLDRHARLRNVRTAFALGSWWPGAAPSARRRLAGRTVVLVDDVLTTGATLGACARVLREAGAREVRAVTAARAELGR